MKNIANSTPMLPGFYMPLRGRKPRSAQQLFADKLDSLKRKSFKQIGEIYLKNTLRQRSLQNILQHIGVRVKLNIVSTLRTD